jgi:hypothetical protein
LVDAGMKIAVIERNLFGGPASTLLHSNENPGRKRLCGEDRTPRR